MILLYQPYPQHIAVRPYVTATDGGLVFGLSLEPQFSSLISEPYPSCIHNFFCGTVVALINAEVRTRLDPSGRLISYYKESKNMQNFLLQKRCILALAIAGILAATPALADKNKGHGDDKKGNKHEQKESRLSQGDDQREMRANTHFNDRQRTIIKDYYSRRVQSGHCPPGLAKKNNGCMPPGQAKKWTVGQPLPRDVIFHNLPREVEQQLGTPPTMQRYVRVANDILLIATGNGTVVDAIENWGN